jgi:VWFA-related protein
MTTPLPVWASALAAAVLAVLPQSPAELIIVSPAADSAVRGILSLEADVRPATLQIAQVVFFVDGQRVCVAPARPYRCSWDAGMVWPPRDIRAVAELRGGGRLVKALRTAASPVTTFRSSADLVAVSVHVRDRRGRPVPRLSLQDFRAFEDGVSQPIVTLADQESPIDLLLALDRSGSMAPAIGELKSSALEFLAALRPIDHPRIAAFSTALTMLAPPGAPREELEAAVRRLTTGGDTALYDAIIEAAAELRAAPGRRAVVVFTDGDDVASQASLKSARTALQTNDVVLYIIAQGKAASDPGLRKQLATLSAETGGLAFFAVKMTALRDRFADILEDLSTEYVLGYSPLRRVGDGGWRRIQVEVGRPDDRYTVRARQGYLSLARGER